MKKGSKEDKKASKKVMLTVSAEAGTRNMCLEKA